MVNSTAIDAMVKKFLKTSDGKAVMKAQGVSLGYTEAEAVLLGNELKSMLTQAFINEQKHTKRFDDSAVKVSVSKRSNPDNFVILVSYPFKTLARSSFSAIDYSNSRSGWSSSGVTQGFTGEGIYDIFALFTSGYDTTKRVYGYWWDNESGGEIFSENGPMRNPLHYPSHNFITRTINEFIARHPGIIVEYPNEWKS